MYVLQMCVYVLLCTPKIWNVTYYAHIQILIVESMKALSFLWHTRKYSDCSRLANVYISYFYSALTLNYCCVLYIFRIFT